MTYTVKYMLTRSEREPHRKKRIRVLYGTTEVDLSADPIADASAGSQLREKLGALLPGWGLGGYHVGEGTP